MTFATLTHKRTICDFECYAVIGEKYVSVKIAKHGSTVAGLLEAWCISVTRQLELGRPWSEIRLDHTGVSFGESVGAETSLIDGLVRMVDYCKGYIQNA